MRYEFTDTLLTVWDKTDTIEIEMQLSCDHIDDIRHNSRRVLPSCVDYPGYSAEEDFVERIHHGAGTRIYCDGVYAVAFQEEEEVEVALDVDGQWFHIARVVETDTPGRVLVEVFGADRAPSLRFVGGMPNSSVA